MNKLLFLIFLLFLQLSDALGAQEGTKPHGAEVKVIVYDKKKIQGADPRPKNLIFDMKASLPDPFNDPSKLWRKAKGSPSLLSKAETKLILDAFPFVTKRTAVSRTLSVNVKTLGNVVLNKQYPNPWILNCKIDNVQNIDGERKFVVTSCVPKTGDGDFDCQMCAPILSVFVIQNVTQPQIKQKLLFFTEDGAFGQAPPAFSLQLSKSIPALLFTYGEGGQGYLSAHGYFVALRDEQLNALALNSPLWKDNEGAIEEENYPAGKCKSEEESCPIRTFAKIYSTPAADSASYPDLIIETNGTWWAQKGKSGPIHSMETFEAVLKAPPTKTDF